MTYVVVENCIKCKYMDCVEVCPVDCFYEGENMLVIHPDECIDCGVCEPECPAEAIKPDTESSLETWLKLNADWVVLSACNTAAGEKPEAPGYTGLARAFIFAGGKRVLASHWPVRDDIARRLSVGTVKRMKAGDGAAEALRSAIRDVRAGKDGEAAADHPALWAPFELFSR